MYNPKDNDNDLFDFFYTDLETFPTAQDFNQVSLIPLANGNFNTIDFFAEPVFVEPVDKEFLNNGFIPSTNISPIASNQTQPIKEFADRLCTQANRLNQDIEALGKRIEAQNDKLKAILDRIDTKNTLGIFHLYSVNRDRDRDSNPAPATDKRKSRTGPN